MEGGPWTFDNAMLVWRKVEEGSDPRKMQLNEAQFWVQLHNMRREMKNSKICEAIGRYLGVFVASDPWNFVKEEEKEFLQVRVAIDITRPLKRKIKLKIGNGQWVWIDFKYERLPSFCFICGVIGHGDRMCCFLYDRLELMENKPYGAWLRATSKKANHFVKRKWLCNSKGERLMGEAEQGGGGGDDEVGIRSIDCSKFRDKFEFEISSYQFKKKYGVGSYDERFGEGYAC